MTETRHNLVNFTKSLPYAPTHVCKREQQDLSPVGWSCCPHNSTTPPRGGSHLPSKYNPTIASNASMSASVGGMTVPQCFSNMCEPWKVSEIPSGVSESCQITCWDIVILLSDRARSQVWSNNIL